MRTLVYLLLSMLSSAVGDAFEEPKSPCSYSEVKCNVEAPNLIITEIKMQTEFQACKEESIS